MFKAADVAPLFKEVTAVTIRLSISITAKKARALSISRNIEASLLAFDIVPDAPFMIATRTLAPDRGPLYLCNSG